MKNNFQLTYPEKSSNQMITILVKVINVIFICFVYNSHKILQNIVDQDLSAEDFPFSSSKLMKANGRLIRVFRISFVGELGYELHIPLESCERVYKGIMEFGKPWDLKLAGYRALYSLSCEKGILNKNSM